jgi:hypothetical protein
MSADNFFGLIVNVPQRIPEPVLVIVEIASTLYTVFRLP